LAKRMRMKKKPKKLKLRWFSYSLKCRTCPKKLSLTNKRILKKIKVRLETQTI